MALEFTRSVSGSPRSGVCGETVLNPLSSFFWPGEQTRLAIQGLAMPARDHPAQDADRTSRVRFQVQACGPSKNRRAAEVQPDGN